MSDKPGDTTIQVSRGHEILHSVPLPHVESSGPGSQFSVLGFIDVDVSLTRPGYDYRKLFALAGLDPERSADDWIKWYTTARDRAEQSDLSAIHDKLVALFATAKETPVKAESAFRMRVVHQGATQIGIGYVVIRLEYQGKSKDFMVANDASMVSVVES